MAKLWNLNLHTFNPHQHCVLIRFVQSHQNVKFFSPLLRSAVLSWDNEIFLHNFDNKIEMYKISLKQMFPFLVNVKKIVKGEWKMESQYHFTMETLTCLAVPVEDGLEVYCTSQWMMLAQEAIGQVLNIPENR